MRYSYANARTKLRKCAAVGLEELENKMKKKELHTELAMISGYVGYIDLTDYGVRIYAFTDADAGAEFIKEARKIGFRTVGEVEGTMALKNTELQRPHLQYMSRHIFLRELYK